MGNLNDFQEDMVFGLDIGTRNIVGVVGYMERNKFKVVAMAAKEHETRAMLDGQIHDIYKVGDTIRNVKNQLEKQLDCELSDVCIAAAGRVLKTINVSAEYEFEEETRVTQEHIYSLDLLAVEKAHTQINLSNSKTKFYCVGNTPVKYMLNEFDINNLEGHKANKIYVELIATFLPEEVVDGLYEAVSYAGLKVANLTLEPIAAINIAIPEQFRLLNIALIDVGAGTSDICITKDGSIISYGMIPFAGDEITEIIAKSCLVDFNTAEKIKVEANNNQQDFVAYNDIMGLPQKISIDELQKITEDIVDNMAKAVAEKITEINGNKPTNAVFVVGGGGKILGYTDKVAKYLGIPAERVAVRGEEVLTSVDFMIEDFKKDSLYVTPVGICTNYYAQKNNFVFINVNNQRIKLYDNNKLTVVDAIMQVGFPNEKLFPRRGKELTFAVNGKTRLIRGSAGEGAVIKLNGKIANLNSPIVQNDIIEVTESSEGSKAMMCIGQLEEFNSTLSFIVDGKTISCPRFAYVNGELKSEFYEICEGDSIRMENYYTLEQLFEFLDINIGDMHIYVNNEKATKNTKVYENFSVKTIFDDTEDTYNYTEQDNSNDTSDTITNTDSLANSNNPDKFNSQESADSAITQNTDNINENTSKARDIVIIINKQPVRLYGKKNYVLVDLFEFYDFDLSTPRGNIVLNLNGKPGNHTALLNDGDIIDLYWDNSF